ncbi:MAG: response regulator transcription factor [candidate division Zixibacteria bacterium]
MSQKTEILLLEDDANFGLILKEHLQMQGFGVTLCVNGAEGWGKFRDNSYDLCLVDVMMPKMDGFTFARKVRDMDQDIPLVFLTAKSLTEDKIKGFGIGCDDYITKPFSIEELLLRLRAIMKRVNARESDNKRVHFKIGKFSFDYNRSVLILNDKERKLTPKEADLLRLLCLNLNKTLDRNEALRKIWDTENYFSGRSMDVFISKLRKYLKDDPRIEIMGIHGKGFRLIVNE